MNSEKQREPVMKLLVIYSLAAVVFFIPFWTYVCFDEWMATGDFKWGNWIFIEVICFSGAFFLFRKARGYGWLRFRRKK
ncbi:hypothetical protein [Bdellovibrio bacteriovorus]|uniref:hypothetical protein n=1 Tax=Bdellovibrio TaxID=958 RepID=UPI0035A90948